MTKAEIIDAVYEKVGGFSKKESAEIVEAVFDTMKEVLADGKKIKISGFGSFILRDKGDADGLMAAYAASLKQLCLDEARRDIDPRHFRAPAGRRHRQRSGAAAGIEDLGAPEVVRQPAQERFPHRIATGAHRGTDSGDLGV